MVTKPSRGPRLWRLSFLAVPFVMACGQRPAVEERGTSESMSQLAASDQLLLASAKIALPPREITPADLPNPQSPGAKYLGMYCGTCHAVPSPAMHSATDWPAVARRMWLRMELLDQFPVPVPTVGERLSMLNYLTDHSLVVSRATLPDAAGRDLFVTTCSRCHELPDPAQHSSADWLSVVRRMMGHMEEILGESLSGEDMNIIARYVGAASS